MVGGLGDRIAVIQIGQLVDEGPRYHALARLIGVACTIAVRERHEANLREAVPELVQERARQQGQIHELQKVIDQNKKEKTTKARRHEEER